MTAADEPTPRPVTDPSIDVAGDTHAEPAGDTPAMAALAADLDRVLDTLDQQVLGQRQAAEGLLVAYLAGGHALLEGVPGIGKTLLARVFASVLGLEFRRIQFTPDLMPADVVGSNVFDQTSRSFHLVEGPVFTQILMADEINRTPPKTQSALLEAMQERQVTIDGSTRALDPSFFVVATQNPIEHEGTYPLPEAQLDRFLLRIEMGHPAPEVEIELFRRAVGGTLAGWRSDTLPAAVLAPARAAELRRASRAIHVAEEMLHYLAALAAAVRASPHVELGISPRAGLALLETARAAALVDGRDFVTPDDVKRYLRPCWQHRLILTAEAELEGHRASRLLTEVADGVEVPK